MIGSLTASYGDNSKFLGNLDRLLPQPEHSQEVLRFVRAEVPAAAVLLVSGMPNEDLAGEAAAAGAGAASPAEGGRG